MFAGEEARVPSGLRNGLAFGTRAHDDEGGEVVGHVTESVGDPRAHAGATCDGGAGIDESVSGVVVDLVGLLGANDADVVGDLLDVGEKIGDRLT